RLELRYTSHHLDHFTFGSSLSHSSSNHSSSGHSISGHSLSRHASPDTIVADSSTPRRFVHPSLARTLRCSEAYLHWRSALLSTMYPPTTSESSAGDSSFESSAGPSYKRCRFRDYISSEDSVEEDIDMDVLEDIEADAMAVEVVVDRDVVTGVDVGIGMKVDVGVDVEDEVEDELEFSDRGTIEVGVDVVAGIDIPDGMLMPGDMEHLEHVEEGFQDLYEHVIEISLQRIEDIEMRQRELEARSLIAGGERSSLLDQVTSLERSNARLRGTMMMKRERADRFRRRVSFMESELRQIRRFRYYDRMRYRRFKTFAARRLEPTRLQDVVRIANNLMDQKLKGYAMKNAENKRKFNNSQKDNRGDMHCKMWEVQKGWASDPGLQGHYMSDYPKLKDQNHRNKTRNKNGVGEARGKAYVLGGGDATPTQTSSR
nr:hypothetical protein [Tanacetum cinerariifolium]